MNDRSILSGAKDFAFNMSDGYRVTPRPRWGHGRAPHPQIQVRLEHGRAKFEKILDNLRAHRSILAKIKYEPDSSDPVAPFWNNVWFSTLDAAALVSLLLTRKPRRLFEIGSGHSTMFAHYAVQVGGLSTAITSIDPNPRAAIDGLCGCVIRAPLEDCAPAIVDELEPGDFLFFDGSHRIFQNSDVTAFFLDVLPRLKPGVLVHVHDVFLPADYPPEWNGLLYSEQYYLAAMLLCGAPPFRVVLPNYFVCTDAALGAKVREVFQATRDWPEIPFNYANPGRTPGVSFWLETTEVSVCSPALSDT
jgi:hypothetical protein